MTITPPVGPASEQPFRPGRKGDSSAASRIFEENKGKIIVLTGIVAAGKSSIVKAVQAVDHRFHEEDLDLRRDPTTPTTPEVETQMIDDTIDRSLRGEPTIISLMKVEKLAERMMERGITGLPIKTVLLHCPFSEIPNRLQARNAAAESQGGDPGNYRNPLVPIDQFAELYTRNEQGMEEIDRSQAIGFFNNAFDEMVVHARKVGDSLPPDERLAIDKKEGCEIFLKQIGFENESQAKISVSPITRYDFVIDSSKYRDQSSREAVVKKLLEE